MSWQRNDRIEAFGKDGVLRRSWELPMTTAFPKVQSELAVFRSGHVLVLDPLRHRGDPCFSLSLSFTNIVRVVTCYSPNGAVTGEFGLNGAGEGEFRDFESMCVDTTRRLVYLFDGEDYSDRRGHRSRRDDVHVAIEGERSGGSYRRMQVFELLPTWFV